MQESNHPRHEAYGTQHANGLANRLTALLERLYEPAVAERLAAEMLALARELRPPSAAAPPAVQTPPEGMLITYADTITTEGEVPLQTLARFLDRHVGDCVGRLHLLPFFPSSSDDGFAVIDYRRVDHRVGSWEDVRALAERYDPMFDLVINHCSRENLWFADFVSDREPGRHYFITLPEGSDVSAVVRPRTSPLISAVPTYAGIRHVWTTFSDDQIDLDFANPAVLREFVEILLFYAAQGARLIRLDAIAFLWKRLGTSCMSLPESHAVVKALRLLLAYAGADVKLVTETNVPHWENVSYFGDGDEAHMVYQFSLAPLLLYSYVFGDAKPLTAWAKALRPPPSGAAYLNFIASHDGIGLRPLEGLVPEDGIARLVERMRERGGFVTLRTRSGLPPVPYEINISPFSAFGGEERNLPAYLGAHSLLMSFQGVPALYIHSLLATPNDLDLVERTGRTRSVNRSRWALDDLEAQLADPTSIPARTLSHFRRALACRNAQPALSADAAQMVLPSPPTALLMFREGGGQRILVAVSVVGERQSVPLGGSGVRPGTYADLLSGRTLAVGSQIELDPYQVAWLAC